MKYKIIILVLVFLFSLVVVPKIWAQQEIANLGVEESTESGGEATEAAALEVQGPMKPRETNLTEPTGPAKGKLEQYLLQKDPGPLSILNFLQHAIRNAVSKGVPATTMVLILLFPIVGAIIAAARHLIGLRGYGLLTTAALSIAFLATGIFVGILLFVVILAAATWSRVLFRRFRLQYLPRIALLLWSVSLAIFAVLVVSPYLGVSELINVSIFPILLLVLLAETFISSQISLSMKRAVELATETIILAVICSLVLSLEGLQRFAVLNPELTVLMVALFNIFLGKYVGLRLLEYWRFKELVGSK